MYDFQQYDGKITVESMYETLQRYEVTNCCDFFEELSEILTEDYNLRRVNILPLLRKGINARLLMCYRMCYIIKAVDDAYYGKIREMSNIDDIVEYRKEWYHKHNLQFSNYDYENWWLMYLSLKPRGQYRDYIQFDYEYLYVDCDPNHKISTINENMAGYVYFRNGHTKVSDTLYRGLVEKLDRDDVKLQELLNKDVWMEENEVPPDIFI